MVNIWGKNEICFAFIPVMHVYGQNISLSSNEVSSMPDQIE